MTSPEPRVPGLSRRAPIIAIVVAAITAIVLVALMRDTPNISTALTAPPAAQPASAFVDPTAVAAAALAKKRLERERAFVAAGPSTVVAEMRRLVSAHKYEAALSYGDPYFDVGDPAFRDAYERASAGVVADTKKRAKALAKKEGVSIGMTKEDVLASSWGKPSRINSTHTAYGTREQWVYPGGYLYFRDGILTAVQY